MLQDENRWSSKSIFNFQYFNCPSCTFKIKQKQEFVDHAFENHYDCVEFLSEIEDGSLDDIKLPWISNAEEKTHILDFFEEENAEIKTEVIENDDEELCEPRIDNASKSYFCCVPCNLYFSSSERLEEHEIYSSFNNSRNKQKITI